MNFRKKIKLFFSICSITKIRDLKMKKKNIIVTGGTDGIGLALVKNLLKQDHYVFMIGKNADKGNEILTIQ